jgi:hypothetical protein
LQAKRAKRAEHRSPPRLHFEKNRGCLRRPPETEAVDFFAGMADDKNTGITEADVAVWIRKYAKPAP